MNDIFVVFRFIFDLTWYCFLCHYLKFNIYYISQCNAMDILLDLYCAFHHFFVLGDRKALFFDRFCDLYNLHTIEIFVQFLYVLILVLHWTVIVFEIFLILFSIQYLYFSLSNIVNRSFVSNYLNDGQLMCKLLLFLKTKYTFE